MEAAANPFAGLGQRGEPPAAPHHAPDGYSKTGVMRALLRRQGRATAAALAEHADLASTGLVYALLKNDIASGRIRFSDEGAVRLYFWDGDAAANDAEEVVYAIRLLRSKGYTVTAPK